MIEIFTHNQQSKFSKLFRVDVGKVVVLSSFNFACPTTNDIGEVTKGGDCAVLHKVNLTSDEMSKADSCNCSTCVLDELDIHITNSEPVMVCGEVWSHNSNNNLSVLSIPGYYMFELCDDSSIGSVTMQLEELTLAQAAMLPRSLMFGE